MKKPIKKNLTDMDMLAGYKENSSFETDLFTEEPPQPKVKPIAQKSAQPDFTTLFLPQQLQEEVGRALLELKVKLYKEGILDYKLKVSQEGRQVIITAAPQVLPKEKPNERKEKKS